MARGGPAPFDGLIVIDKPPAATSHDVVARMRRVAGMRKVGHAGTLDPMATGVLVLGLGRATRLLGHLALHDKDYLATIRLGMATITDDAQGDDDGGADAAHISDAQILIEVAKLTGDIEQVPSKVSALKIDGERAHRLVRAGEDVVLAPRPVRVSRFDVLDVRRVCELSDPWTFVDIDVAVTCSTGTYVRALARDIGAALRVGGHLTALRRTRVGAFDVDQAHELTDDFDVARALVSLPSALTSSFGAIAVTQAQVEDIRHGRPFVPGESVSGLFGVLGPDGGGVALMDVDADRAVRSLAVFL